MLPDTEASAGQAVRAAIAAEGADTERPTPVYFGEGSATAASAENSARFLAWRWDCGQSRGRGWGRTRPHSGASPEVDLIRASFAGAQQHGRGAVRARSSCLQTSAQENRSCNHPGTNQSVSSLRV